MLRGASVDTGYFVCLSHAPVALEMGSKKSTRRCEDLSSCECNEPIFSLLKGALESRGTLAFVSVEYHLVTATERSC